MSELVDLATGEVLIGDERSDGEWEVYIREADPASAIVERGRRIYEYSQHCRIKYKKQGGSHFSAFMKERFGMDRRRSSDWRLIGESAKELSDNIGHFVPDWRAFYDFTRLDEDQKQKLLESPEQISQKTIKALKSDLLEKAKAEKAARDAESISHNQPGIVLESYESFLFSVEDDSVDLLITDPPYSTDVDDIDLFVSDWLGHALDKIKPDGRAFICTGAYPDELRAYLNYLLADGRYIVDAPLIWTYRNALGVTPKKKYNLNYQVIFHLYSDQSRDLDTSITNEMFSVQDINAPDGRQGDRFHSWQKPDELANRLIRHSCIDGDIVIDPFACTGTFLIAAARYGCLARGCDIDQDAIDIALSRGCINV